MKIRIEEYNRNDEFLMDFIEGDLREAENRHNKKLSDSDIYKVLAEEEEIEMYEITLYDEFMEN